MAIISVRVVSGGRHWPLIRRVERGKANQKRKASNRPYILEHSACNKSLGNNLMVKKSVMRNTEMVDTDTSQQNPLKSEMCFLVPMIRAHEDGNYTSKDIS